MDCCSNLLTPQCKAALLTTPALTRVLLFINISIYAMGFLVPRDSIASATEAPGHFCLSAASVSEDSSQYYRILSTAFFHLSLMHIAFNCMTLHNVGSVIESRAGTLSFAVCTLVLTPLCGLMNVAASVGFSYIGYDDSMKECAAGFSGVLFAYVTIQALHRDSGSYSIYGFFSVPAKWYPLCMLVLTQILLPQSSFVGHLGGIIAGIMYSVVESRLPSFACFTQIERACSCPTLFSCCYFVPYPDPLPIQLPRIIQGVVVGEAFFAEPPLDNVDDQHHSQPSESWLQRLRSWFPSRYQQVNVEMQPSNAP